MVKEITMRKKCTMDSVQAGLKQYQRTNICERAFCHPGFMLIIYINVLKCKGIIFLRRESSTFMGDLRCLECKSIFFLSFDPSIWKTYFSFTLPVDCCSGGRKSIYIARNHYWSPYVSDNDYTLAGRDNASFRFFALILSLESPWFNSFANLRICKFDFGD